MDRTVQFYDSSTWNYTVNNNEESIKEVIAGMLNQLATELTHFSVRSAQNSFNLHFSTIW